MLGLHSSSEFAAIFIPYGCHQPNRGDGLRGEVLAQEIQKEQRPVNCRASGSIEMLDNLEFEAIVIKGSTGSS